MLDITQGGAAVAGSATARWSCNAPPCTAPRRRCGSPAASTNRSAAVGFTTWAYALARSSAGRPGATTYLVPPLALLLGWVLLGWVLLGGTPPPLAVLGGAICLAGVALTRRTPPGR
jgi:hypothetical protein